MKNGTLAMNRKMCMEIRFPLYLFFHLFLFLLFYVFLHSLSAEEGSDSSEDISNLLNNFPNDTNEIPQIFQDTSIVKAPADYENKTFPDQMRKEYFELKGGFNNRVVLNTGHTKPAKEDFDFRGISSLRSNLKGELKTRFNNLSFLLFSGHGFYDFAAAHLRDQQELNTQYFKNYKQEYEIDELYFYVNLFKILRIWTGRQIVNTGTADFIRVLDFLCPVDLREIGLVDISELRLPIAMTRLGLNVGPLTVNGYLTHEFRTNKLSTYGSDFFYIRSKNSVQKELPYHKANFNLVNGDLILQVQGNAGPVDFNIIGGEYWSREPRVIKKTDNSIHLIHDKLKMTGIGTSLVLGDILIKNEIALKWDFGFLDPSKNNYKRVEILFGMENNKFKDMQLRMNVLITNIFNGGNLSEYDPNTPRQTQVLLAGQVVRDFIYDRLQFSFTMSSAGIIDNAGAHQRLSLRYELRDNFYICVSFLSIVSGYSHIYKGIGDADRLTLETNLYF